MADSSSLEVTRLPHSIVQLHPNPLVAAGVALVIGIHPLCHDKGLPTPLLRLSSLKRGRQLLNRVFTELGEDHSHLSGGQPRDV